MSKACLNALTEVHQRQFNKDPRADLIVNSMCPGLTSTGMSSFNGHSTEEGFNSIKFSVILNKKVKSKFLF